VKVTDHFHVHEFDQPERHGLPGEAYPERLVETILRPLCVQLEIIRARFGKPITITSGWRSPAYNKAVKGKTLSRHKKGDAADFTVDGVHPAEVHAEVLRMHKAKALKIGGLGKYDGFTHVDTRPPLWPGRLAKW